MNKAFTLMEMMGVITLLGILAVVIGVDVNMHITESRKETCKIQEANIIDAAKTYFYDNAYNLPTIDKKVKLSITNVLKNEGYLEKDLKNPMTNKLYSDGSYVSVSTNNEKNYEYEVIYVDEKDCNGK